MAAGACALFFASDQEFIDSFQYAEDPPKIIIDSEQLHTTLSGQLAPAH